MTFWLIVLAAVLIAFIGSLIYLASGFRRFAVIREYSKEHKTAAWLISFAAVAVIALPWLLVNVWAMAVVLIHLFIFWAIFDLIALCASKLTKKKSAHNYSGGIALAFTAAYLSLGWMSAHNVVQTNYEIRTWKAEPVGLRLAVIADLHLGITMNGEEFAEEVAKIAECKPDAVLICGDFVDDDSCRADMERACRALGELKPIYGKYFTFGNHDKGYYQSGRDFSVDDLRYELINNGVMILEDEKTELVNNVYVIGRQDKSLELDGERASISELMEGIPREAYTIVMDHQPNDYDAESKAEVDLVVSGHTHGGHVFPTGYVGTLTGVNDAIYGYEKRGATNFVVTSGISGWAIPFKTGTKSEYVIIDIQYKE